MKMLSRHFRYFAFVAILIGTVVLLQNCSSENSFSAHESSSAANTSKNSNTAIHQWDVTAVPPVMDNPVTITLPGNYLGTTTHALCSGPSYNLTLDNNKDYIIKTTEVLRAPVSIYGGRNVRVIGIQIDLATAPCADQGASGYIPGTIALKAYQTGTTFVEGAYIDLAGRSADCIDARNFIGGFDALAKPGFTEISARGERDVVIQNTVCKGMSGDIHVHGDISQTQGRAEIFRNFVFENISTDSNCEGIILQPRQGMYLANSVTIRRFDYRKDYRYSPNPVATGGFYEGGAIMHSAKAYHYDQVYLVDNEAPYEMTPALGDRFASVRPPCNSGGIFCAAAPAGNRFASPGVGNTSAAWTGLNYVSPHK